MTLQKPLFEIVLKVVIVLPGADLSGGVIRVAVRITLDAGTAGAEAVARVGPMLSDFRSVHGRMQEEEPGGGAVSLAAKCGVMSFGDFGSSSDGTDAHRRYNATNLGYYCS